MTIKERVKELCRERGITVQQLETTLKISNGTISKWGNSKPSFDNMLSISRYFGVDPVYLATGEPMFSTGLSSSSSIEGSLLNSFRNLNEEGQEKVIEYINLLVNSGIYKKNSSDGMVEKGA